MLAEMAVDSLEKAIKKKEPIVVPGAIPNAEEVKFALRGMDFIPKDVLGFLGGSMTLGSIEKGIEEHKRVMLRSAVLKSLAGRVPYLENLQVSEELSKFAFGSFVSVSDKPYAKIISQIDTLLSSNKDNEEELKKLEGLLGEVLKDCPNIYGSLGEKTREINAKSRQLMEGIKAIEDIQTRRKVVESILLRCIFSYGTAEIARRGNEEAWARIHGAGMAYNPQFPGIDNVTTIKNDDGTYTIIPMSHKMHMTKKSNKPEVELGDMEVIGKLMIRYKDDVHNKVTSRLAEILKADDAQQKESGLNAAIKDLEDGLKKGDCTKVNWRGVLDENERSRRDNCFKMDYERMILLSLSPHIATMKKGDQEKLEWEPITLVRYRDERVEFWKRISLGLEKLETPDKKGDMEKPIAQADQKDDEDNTIELFTIVDGGKYIRQGYEDREETIRKCINSHVSERKRISGDNSQVQQPQTK
jgi:hypothetical protein